MQMQFRHLVAVAALFAAGTTLAGTPGDAFAKCREEPSHVDQGQCWDRELTKKMKEISSAEASLRSRIKAYFSNKEDKLFLDNALQALDASISAFRKYQESVCATAAASTGPGNASTDITYACEYEMAVERIALVKSQEALYP